MSPQSAALLEKCSLCMGSNQPASLWGTLDLNWLSSKRWTSVALLRLCSKPRVSVRATQLDYAWDARDCKKDNSWKWAAGLYNRVLNPAVSVRPSPAWGTG